MAHDKEKVGYRRPPKSGQFKPGQSGNPKGRKKHVANFKTDLMDELREVITVRENGRERKISKQKAFVKTLMALAIKGDIRAINALVACTKNLGLNNDGNNADDADFEDLSILEDYLDRERLRRERVQNNAPVKTPKRKEPKS